MKCCTPQCCKAVEACAPQRCLLLEAVPEAGRSIQGCLAKVSFNSSWFCKHKSPKAPLAESKPLCFRQVSLQPRPQRHLPWQTHPAAPSGPPLPLGGDTSKPGMLQERQSAQMVGRQGQLIRLLALLSHHTNIKLLKSPLSLSSGLEHTSHSL